MLGSIKSFSAILEVCCVILHMFWNLGENFFRDKCHGFGITKSAEFGLRLLRYCHCVPQRNKELKVAHALHVFINNG